MKKKESDWSASFMYILNERSRPYLARSVLMDTFLVLLEFTLVPETSCLSYLGTGRITRGVEGCRIDLTLGIHK